MSRRTDQGVDGEQPTDIGYCGLVCRICEHRCPCKEDPDYGDPNCYQRKCCQEKRIEGCWRCRDFPCNEGGFKDGNEWRGVCVASVMCAKERGPEEFIRLCEENLGARFRYSAFLGCDPAEALRRLRRRRW